MASNSDKELEQQLLEAGNKLVNPPSSVDQLLPLLDQVERCLSRVEQSPSKSMQNTLTPSLNALVTDQLFGHSNTDVKVAVASCISEITRITAPEAPYDDDQMRDVFQLIVSSFENLADKSSRSYEKRASILETVAKVRSCVVMLDLECDALIIEMFQHFFKAIRDYHPENVFSSMVTIMTLVLEESEDISVELLSPILSSVKKGDKEVLPIARRLGEKVLESCATKVKPALIQAVKDLGISLEDYTDIVSSICQEISGTVEQNDVHASDENKVEESKPVEASSDAAAQTDEEKAIEMASPERAANEKSPKSAVSNGVIRTTEDDSLPDSDSLKKQEDVNHTDQLKNIDVSGNIEAEVLDAEKVVNTESEAEQTAKKTEGKSDSSTKLAESSDISPVDSGKEAKELPGDKSDSKDAPSSPQKEPSAEEAASSENKKETSSQPSSPKVLGGEPVTIASPSVSRSPPDETVPKKGGRSKKKESINKHSAPSSDDVLEKISEGTSDSEAKPNKRSGKKMPSEASDEDKTPTVTEASKKESSTSAEPEAKSLKQSSKKVDGGVSNDDGSSSLKQSEDKKRRGKAIPEKAATKSSTKDDGKLKTPSSTKAAGKSVSDEHHSDETPVTSVKRKRAPDSAKGSDTKQYDKSLIGLKVKVWWPTDRQFYEGTIESFDPIKKKHKVVYTDGDIEVLNLKREKFEFIRGDAEPDEEKEEAPPSPDSSSEIPLKKRMKTSTDQATKQGKAGASAKKGGGASSSQSRSATARSGGKSKEVSKTDGKSADGLKAVKKTEDRGKNKDHTPKSGSKPDVASKSASKSKKEDAVASKTSKSKEDGTSTPKNLKSKQETSKTSRSKQDTSKVSSSSAKAKSSKSSGKSNVNGTGKLKSVPSMVKESDDDETSTDSGKPQESAKRKSGSSSKGQTSEVKSGKKRRRT